MIFYEVLSLNDWIADSTNYMLGKFFLAFCALVCAFVVWKVGVKTSLIVLGCLVLMVFLFYAIKFVRFLYGDMLRYLGIPDEPVRSKADWRDAAIGSAIGLLYWASWPWLLPVLVFDIMLGL